MLPKFRALGAPKEKTVAMSAEAAIDPVIDWAWASDGRASMPSAAKRRSERFTEDSFEVVIDCGMIWSIALAVSRLRSLLLDVRYTEPGRSISLRHSFSWYRATTAQSAFRS